MSLIKAILPFWLAVGYHTWEGAGERRGGRAAILLSKEHLAVKQRGLFPFRLTFLISLNINRFIISANFFHRSLHLSLKEIVQLWQEALRMFFTIHQMLNTCSDLSAHSCQIGPAWGSLLLKVSHRWWMIFYPFNNTHTFASGHAAGKKGTLTHKK